MKVRGKASGKVRGEAKSGKVRGEAKGKARGNATSKPKSQAKSKPRSPATMKPKTKHQQPFPEQSTEPTSKSNEIPVFRPTWEEFKDFSAYVSSIESSSKAYGLCKVIPPKEFIARKKGYHFNGVGYAGTNPRCDPKEVSKALKSGSFPEEDPVIIHNPVRQNLLGNRGIYSVYSVEEKDYMTVEMFRDECNKMHLHKSRREKDKFRENNYPEIERAYWSNISNRKPPLYGADSPGSLFDSECTTWNCTKLGTILDLIRDDLPGVTVPMLYFGMWQSTFAWHVEDMNLFSINYLHFGHPKQWYCIPASHFEQSERLLQSLYPLEVSIQTNLTCHYHSMKPSLQSSPYLTYSRYPN